MDNLLTALSTQIADAVERAGPGVVQVRSGRWRPSSGTVYAADRVLTVDRGFDDDDRLSVRGPDGRVLSASFGGSDPSTGLALLRVDGLGVTPLSAASGLPRVGSLIVSIGRGMSGGLIAGSGLVSSVGGPLRTGRGPAIDTVIRTDVTAYPGFSGGPVVDPLGQVVGVATGVQLRGLGLVIPASIAWQVADTLSTHGRIRRGYLGINSQPVRIPESQRAGQPGDHGLLVVGVGPDSPAARAALLVGDIVVDFDGQPIADAEQLLVLLGGDRVGKSVPVGVIRAGGYQRVQVLVAER